MEHQESPYFTCFWMARNVGCVMVFWLYSSLGLSQFLICTFYLESPDVLNLPQYIIWKIFSVIWFHVFFPIVCPCLLNVKSWSETSIHCNLITLMIYFVVFRLPERTALSEGRWLFQCFWEWWPFWKHLVSVSASGTSPYHGMDSY